MTLREAEGSRTNARRILTFSKYIRHWNRASIQGDVNNLIRHFGGSSNSAVFSFIGKGAQKTRVQIIEKEVSPPPLLTGVRG